MIVMMAFCMVIGMVTFMSMYGLASSYYANGLEGNHCLEATSPFSLKFRVCAAASTPHCRPDRSLPVWQVESKTRERIIIRRIIDWSPISQQQSREFRGFYSD